MLALLDDGNPFLAAPLLVIVLVLGTFVSRRRLIGTRHAVAFGAAHGAFVGVAFLLWLHFESGFRNGQDVFVATAGSLGLVLTSAAIAAGVRALGTKAAQSPDPR